MSSMSGLASERLEKTSSQRPRQLTTVEKRRFSEFAIKCHKVAIANRHLKMVVRQQEGGESPSTASTATTATTSVNGEGRCDGSGSGGDADGGGDCAVPMMANTMSSIQIIKNVPLDVLVEEALQSEIDHLEEIQKLSAGNLKKYLSDTAQAVMRFATLAMEEIDKTGREKLLVVSAVAEQLDDRHAVSMVNEEIMSVKLTCGKDNHCLDQFDKVVGFEEPRRIPLIEACINNAFFRDGREPKGVHPISVYFQERLFELGDFVARDKLRLSDLIFKAKKIEYELRRGSGGGGDDNNKDHDNVGQQQQQQQQQFGGNVYPRDDEQDEYRDDDDDDDDDEYLSSPPSLQTTRRDVPSQITIGMTTAERAKLMFEFHERWYMWLKKMPSLPPPVSTVTGSQEKKTSACDQTAAAAAVAAGR